MLNAQQIFDKVALHLIKQGRRSYVSALCKYRDGTGGSCAVGCLIPDEKYQPEFDDSGEYPGTSVFNMVEQSTAFREALLAGGVDPKEYLALLVDLQEAHDGWLDVADGHNLARLIPRLQRLARVYGLRTSVLFTGLNAGDLSA